MGLNWTIFQGSVSADFADVSRAKKKYKKIPHLLTVTGKV